MNLILEMQHLSEALRPFCGGKFFALAQMAARGLAVPKAVCVATEGYRQYLQATGIGERILMELHRKDFEEMRWEEMWDTSLRIRNMFLRTPLPEELHGQLFEAMERHFRERAVVVRSSAPGEDSAKASFAGLHESYVNVLGTEAILEHIVRVWASLWSDAALLYRRELGLRVETSAMAVVVQEIVLGERSGVAFSRNPDDFSQAVIESVHGLNQGLVDGTVEPDRWFVGRESGRIVRHMAAKRKEAVFAGQGGVRLEALSSEKAEQPPLRDPDVSHVFNLAMKAEALFKAPQDVEWTFSRDTLYALQSRPITSRKQEPSQDQRPWYMSLRRNFENLKALRQKIEEELIPAMVKEGSDLARLDMTAFSDKDLSDEIARRVGMHDHWVKVYWRDFIPFAHGMRLFGQVYNDAMHPSDPYEFMDLLANTEMLSMSRNRQLEDMAALIREDKGLRQALQEKKFARIRPEFSQKLDDFVKTYQDLACGKGECFQGRDAVIAIVLEMASRAPRKSVRKDVKALKESFLGRLEAEERGRAEDLLDLARASYRLRDDDNIYLGRIEGQVLASLEEGRRRLSQRGLSGADDLDAHEVMEALKHAGYVPAARKTDSEEKPGFLMRPRQLVGQPAGPGLGKGIARVIEAPSDLLGFRAGEILVCDAIEPNMTFVVPLTAGIVERRGGMLIHGAIIAREYGLPCVTGIPDATSLIHTGDLVTVDGYLGIVTIG